MRSFHDLFMGCSQLVLGAWQDPDFGSQTGLPDVGLWFLILDPATFSGPAEGNIHSNPVVTPGEGVKVELLKGRRPNDKTKPADRAVLRL